MNRVPYPLEKPNQNSVEIPLSDFNQILSFLHETKYLKEIYDRWVVLEDQNA